jgi:hypothetical protein
MATTPRLNHRLNLLAMFAGPLESDAEPHFDMAARYLGPYGFTINTFPHPTRSVATPYKALHDMTGSLFHDLKTFETIRGWARYAYRDQVVDRCLVVFCRMTARDNPAAHQHFDTAPRSVILIDPVKARAYWPCLAHEVGHAAGLNPHNEKLPDDGHDLRPDNLMYKGNKGSRGDSTGSKLDTNQVNALQSAYFTQCI